MTSRPEDLQATFCATLVDEWVRCGVEHAVVCPGSRSTPLALAVAAEPRIEVLVQHDERSGGFLALGLAIATGEPVVVLTTSGTGAAELHPAVVEADLAAVPLIVCTADRPPELRDVGAPQAIDQTHLFGRSVRWFHEPGAAGTTARATWRPLAARAYAEATGPRCGPVHLNLAFREPLVGVAGPLPAARDEPGAAWSWRPGPSTPSESVLTASTDLAGRRGVFVAGAAAGAGPEFDRLARALGWPVLAAPHAPVWGVPGACIPCADALLRVPQLADRLRPELVVHLGGPLASRVTGEWLAATGAPHVVVAGPGSWVDPYGVASVVLPVDADQQVESWLRELGRVATVDDGAWRAEWERLGRLAEAAVERTLATTPGSSEPGVARALLASVPPGGRLVASSSMPVRDLEWYARPERPVLGHANRGANGIDGVVSTALGIALGSGTPTGLLIGDVAFLHDSNGLLGVSERSADLVVVVVDNDGGGIFSFLPQAAAVPAETFELLYGTPHGLDLVSLAAAYGVPARAVDDVATAAAEAFAAGGVHVLVVRTDRQANAALHARLNEAVADAVGEGA